MSFSFIITLCVGILLYFVVIGKKPQIIFIRFMRSFSSLIYLSFIKIPIPGNIMLFNSILLTAVTFDPLDYLKIWERIGFVS